MRRRNCQYGGVTECKRLPGYVVFGSIEKGAKWRENVETYRGSDWQNNNKERS